MQGDTRSTSEARYMSHPPVGDDEDAAMLQPPEPLQEEQWQGLKDELDAPPPYCRASRRELRMYGCLGVFVGYFAGPFCFFSLCCFPTVHRDSAVMRRYIFGLFVGGVLWFVLSTIVLAVVQMLFSMWFNSSELVQQFGDLFGELQNNLTKLNITKIASEL